MKIPIQEKVQTTKEIEISPGDLILMRFSQTQGYRLAELEEIVEEGSSFGVKTTGCPYTLHSINVLGVRYPSIVQRDVGYNRRTWYFGGKPYESGRITDIWVGKEEIIKFFQDHEDEGLRAYADLIRKISAQRAVKGE